MTRFLNFQKHSPLHLLTLPPRTCPRYYRFATTPRCPRRSVWAVRIALGERLEKLKERHEQGLLHSLDFLKELLTLAKEVIQAERKVDPVDEQTKVKAALTELFAEFKNGKTPIVVERIVSDIDEIVRLVRFPGWQTTKAREREVQKALRKVIYVKYQVKDQDLFDKVFGYIRQYY